MNLIKFAYYAFVATGIASVFAVLIIGLVLSGFHPTPETFM